MPYHNLLSEGLFFIVGEISGVVVEITASEIPTMLYDPVTSSYIGGKKPECHEVRGGIQVDFRGIQTAMSSVLALAKHTQAEQQW